MYLHFLLHHCVNRPHGMFPGELEYAHVLYELVSAEIFIEIIVLVMRNFIFWGAIFLHLFHSNPKFAHFP